MWISDTISKPPFTHVDLLTFIVRLNWILLATGNWEWVDGSPIDMDFLRAHSSDQLAGVGENQGVFYPPTYAGDPNQGLHDWDNRNQVGRSMCGN